MKNILNSKKQAKHKFRAPARGPSCFGFRGWCARSGLLEKRGLPARVTAQQRPSSVDVVKVELAVGALDHERVLSLLLDDACVHQVAHEDSCSSVVVSLLLHLLHLLLELVELCELGADLVLPVKLRL